MMSMFSDLVEEVVEIFMDDFSVYGSSFEKCFKNLEAVTPHIPGVPFFFFFFTIVPSLSRQRIPRRDRIPLSQACLCRARIPLLRHGTLCPDMGEPMSWNSL